MGLGGVETGKRGLPTHEPEGTEREEGTARRFPLCIARFRVLKANKKKDPTVHPLLFHAGAFNRKKVTVALNTLFCSQ
jgi:hypothetical protein